MLFFFCILGRIGKWSSNKVVMHAYDTKLHINSFPYNVILVRRWF